MLTQSNNVEEQTINPRQLVSLNDFKSLGADGLEGNEGIGGCDLRILFVIFENSRRSARRLKKG